MSYKNRLVHINKCMLKDLLNTRIYGEIIYKVKEDSIEEIRLTINSPIVVYANGKRNLFRSTTKDDINYTLSQLTRDSLYAVNDTLKHGYVTYLGGIRVGIGGEIVYANDKLQTMKNVNTLVLRIPHNQYGIADEIKDKLMRKDGTIKNVLISAPPYTGKTTLLRELSRIFSLDGYRVVVLDEKNEISGNYKGETYLDVGYSSVLVGVNRKDGIEMAIRNLSPDIIVTDEIFGESDVSSIERCVKSGVSVFTSMHSGVLQLDGFMKLFDFNVVLSKNPVGKILLAKDVSA